MLIYIIFQVIFNHNKLNLINLLYLLLIWGNIMIRKTLLKVKEATFCIELPNKELNNMQTPAGTGFLYLRMDGFYCSTYNYG